MNQWNWVGCRFYNEDGATFLASSPEEAERMATLLNNGSSDTKRLDWLEHEATSIYVKGGEEMWCQPEDNADWDLRSDIDAAQAAADSSKEPTE